MSAVPPARSPQDRLGPYELVAKLGVGAMGEVWQALLHGPGGFRKPVALKCLRPGLVKGPEREARLLREARLGAVLHHPNVVGTLGLSQHAGSWVVALELVRGASIQDLRRSNRVLPPRAVLDVGVQVAMGLAHIHEAGLVHRDIKPANLLLDRTGFVKVADLGISLLMGEASGAAGTPGYMAPEQILGRVDPRVDLFALGATLFLLATGKRAFGHGRDVLPRTCQVEALLHHGLLAPAAEAVAGLDEVLYLCLRADPSERWQTARHLAAALAALRTDQPVGGPTLLDLLAKARPGLSVDSTPSGGSGGPTQLLPSGNLVPQRGPLIGRITELAELRSLVEGPRRLLVLLGPGGIGKTRLACDLARVIRTTLAGGAWLFDLTEARSEQGICAILARALHIGLDHDDPVGQLGRVLSSKGRCLMVLDNLEQCVDHLPATLARWLDAAPQITFLGTSRVAPRLRGEVVIGVGPLAAQDAGALFVARASRPLTDAEQPEVAGLCAALEGMPLAIELAAARVHLLGVPGIHSRLSLAVLSGGHTALPERHRSLAASLDWSAELLSAPCRAALWQLSVFEGSFTLEAAEAVLDAAGALQALEPLEELVDASLLRVDSSSGRFSMLTVVREFATTRVDPVGREAAEARHGAHYAQLGSQQALKAFARSTQVQREVASDLDNLVAACQRATAREDERVAITTLRAAWAVMRLRGPYPTARALARALVQIQTLTPAGRAAATGLSGVILSALGRLDEAATCLEQALQLYRELADRQHEGHTLGQLGSLRMHAGQIDEARTQLEQALLIAREVGDREAEGLALNDLGSTWFVQGRLPEARVRYEVALQVHTEVGDPSAQVMGLVNLANLYRTQGDRQLAWDHYEAALQTSRKLDDRRSMGIVLGSLGSMLHERGDTVRAVAHFEEALKLHREIGARTSEAVVVGNLGNVHREQGRTREARRHFEQALRGHREVGNRRAEGIALINLGSLDLEEGRSRSATTYLHAARTLHRELGDRRFEGHVLGQLAAVRLAEGHPADALELLDQGEVLLRQVGEPAMLSTLLATRAEVWWELGETEAAGAALDEAQQIAPADQVEAQRAVRKARERLGRDAG